MRPGIVPSWAMLAHVTLLDMPDGGLVTHPPLCQRCRRWVATERGWCRMCVVELRRADRRQARRDAQRAQR